MCYRCCVCKVLVAPERIWLLLMGSCSMRWAGYDVFFGTGLAQYRVGCG